MTGTLLGRWTRRLAASLALGAVCFLSVGWAQSAGRRQVAASLLRHGDDLDVDAVTFLTSVPYGPPTVWVTGTARSSSVPPGRTGANGYEDWQWCEALGAAMGLRGLVPATGAGPGAMEAPLVGYQRARLAVRAGTETLRPCVPVTRGLEWQRPGPDPDDQTDPHGAAIRLSTEQKTNPELEADDVCVYRDFLFRMKHLFYASTEHLNTPGGLGTTAEFLYQMTERTLGRSSDPIFFGAPDDFYTRLNGAFTPFMGPEERALLASVQTDPHALVEAIANGRRGAAAEEPLPEMLARTCEDLRRGLRFLATQTAGHGEAVAILGGAGPISTGVAGLVAEVGAELAGASIPVRVGGSPVLDAAVYRGVKAAKPDAEVQAFALDGDPVADASGMKHLRVHDFLVLNELVATGARGFAVVPDGSRPLATLFISACDLQTRQIEPLPLVVIDPEGRFAQLRRVMHDCMLSASRRYIDPGDLDLFTLTGTAREAARAARASPARKDDLPRTQTEG